MKSTRSWRVDRDLFAVPYVPTTDIRAVGTNDSLLLTQRRAFPRWGDRGRPSSSGSRVAQAGRQARLAVQDGAQPEAETSSEVKRDTLEPPLEAER